MNLDDAQRAREAVDAVYRTESRRVLATLIRLLGDFDLAEEALHDAFNAAIEQWPRDGVPANPRAWLVSAGRFKAIDGIRRHARFSPLEEDGQDMAAPDDPTWDDEDIEDDRLRLIFTCCHPALPADARVALTLREVCGLTTEEIAHAFLTAAPTLAQRIVRAKNKIRAAKIPYQVPSREALPERLDSVLRVIYLVFNEGYAASSGASLTRHDVAPIGPYTLQAAISAVHAEAADAAATDWAEIVGLYDVLLRIEPSPVVALNRAVAIAMRDGPAAGLALVDAILSRGELVDYRLAHAARADLCRRLGRIEQARASYERALELTHSTPERRFLERRLRELSD